MSPVRQGLLRMVELLRQGHCRGTCARDAVGRAVDPESPEARSWCVVGAAIRACGRTDLSTEVLAQIKRTLGQPVFPHPQGGYYTDLIASESDRLGPAVVEVVVLTLSRIP